MDKKKLTRRLITENGGKIFISQRQIRKITGHGRELVEELLADCDYRVVGKNHAHVYLVDDVAAAMCK